MFTLLVIGFLVGFVTGISPCIIPVLPVIVAGGAAVPHSVDHHLSKWRPFLIIGGLVVSFSLLTLMGSWLLSLLGLPANLLRDLGIFALIVIGFALLIPTVGELVERPFARLGARRTTGSASGFLLGLSLGLVFAPCAGPFLSAMSFLGGKHRFGFEALFLTLSFSLGAGIPLLALAIVAQRSASKWKVLRTRIPMVRRVGGVIMLIMSIVLIFHLADPLQNHVPGYASNFEKGLDGSPTDICQLDRLQSRPCPETKTTNPGDSQGPNEAAAVLSPATPAPDFTGITGWLNTPGNSPLTLLGLKGKVVLVDFWTYSCINCQRTLPHVEAWYNAYQKDGFVVVGVHTPEFTFEYNESNVKAAAARLGVKYPIAIDDNYGTWQAYSNNYWPAEYLIDQNGNVRHTQLGEGDYAGTESAIRTLLQAGGATDLPQATEVADRTPTDELTAETYLGSKNIVDRSEPYAGNQIQSGNMASYTAPRSLGSGEFAFNGMWAVGQESASAGTGANLQMAFQANHIYLVLGGQGTVEVLLNGTHLGSIPVSGVPTLYTMADFPMLTRGLLQLNFTPGVEAFAFTFG